MDIFGIGMLPHTPLSHMWMFLIAFFIFSQTSVEAKRIVGGEARAAYGFSIRERLARGRRQRAFFQSVEERKSGDARAGFHRCAACGRTERDAPSLEFRVCSDCTGGEEYCSEHLRNHRHL